MTRINCIPPEYLLDQHLLAEYNETAMVHASLKRSIVASEKKRQPLPKREKYTLNSGHVIFFYDKGKFLKRRYDALCVELEKRGYHLDPNRVLDWDLFHSVDGWNDWAVTLEAQLENLDRIYQRYMLKPDWYRYKRQPVEQTWVKNLYLGWTKLEPSKRNF